MKHFKKVAFGAAALCCAAALSAQEFTPEGFEFLKDTSNQYKASGEIVKNDADNFMDVNNFGTVNPKNFFGTLGYDVSGLNLGVAKNFGKIYGSAYFTGNLGFNFENKSETEKVSSDATNYKNHSYSSESDDTDYAFALLGGFNDIGVKFGFSYKDGTKPTIYEKKTLGSTEVETITKKQYATVIPTLTAGVNLKDKKASYKINASYAMRFNNDYEYTSTNNAGEVTSTETNNTTVDTFVGGELIAVLAPTDVKQEAGVGFYTAFYGEVKDSKHYDWGMSILPVYKLNYDKVSGLNLGVKVTCPIEVEFTGTNDKTDTYKSSVYVNTITLTPALNMGLSYDVVPKKFAFNVGAGVELPKMGWGFSGSKITTDTSKNTDNEVAWMGEDSSCILNLDSGFAWTIADTVTFDCSYNIVGDLFNNTLNSKWAAGNGTNFWNTVNQVLVHQLSAKINVKF